MLLLEISSNNFFENPGTPIIPLPSIVNNAIFLICVIPLTVELLSELTEIIVPGFLLSNVFLM